MFSPHLNKLRTFVTTSPRRDHTTASKQPTHLHDHCSPHRDHLVAITRPHQNNLRTFTTTVLLIVITSSRSITRPHQNNLRTFTTTVLLIAITRPSSITPCNLPVPLTTYVPWPTCPSPSNSLVTSQTPHLVLQMNPNTSVSTVVSPFMVVFVGITLRTSLTPSTKQSSTRTQTKPILSHSSASHVTTTCF